MRNIISSITEAVQTTAADFRNALSRHFSLSIGGDMPGLFVKVPFTSLSAWVEWGTPATGLGTNQASKTDLEFFLGTVRGVLSIEKSVERSEA